MTWCSPINDENPTWTLSNGYEFPIVCFETSLPIQKTEQAVKDAIDVGYRHFMTARHYKNEKEVLYFILNWINHFF